MTMKEIHEFINELNTEELVRIYEKEYLPFIKTGICPNGTIRKVAQMFNELTGSYEIRFAEQLVIYRMAELFHLGNKEIESDASINKQHPLGHNCF